MSSQELLQLITRNRTSFSNENLKRKFTNDTFSGSMTERNTDPGFLSRNSTGVCMKNGKICVCRKTARMVKNGKNKRSVLKLTRSCQLLDNSKATLSNAYVGKKMNKLLSLQARKERAERRKKIKK